MLMQAIEAKLGQWEREALVFCALHGKAGGLFDVYRWANGREMAEPVLPDGREALPNQCITLEQLRELRLSNWTIIV